MLFIVSLCLYAFSDVRLILILLLLYLQMFSLLLLFPLILPCLFSVLLSLLLHHLRFLLLLLGIASPSSVLVTATRSAPPSNARRFSNDPHEQALYDAVAAVQAPAVNAIRGSITLFGQEERLAIEREKKAQIRRDLGE